MRICSIAIWVAGLLAAMPVAGRAQTVATDVQEKASGEYSFSLGKSAMSPDDVRDMNMLPDAEKRHRLDVVINAHSADLLARFLRLQLVAKLGDAEAVLADSEVVLANPSLERLPRQWALDWRADSLAHLRRNAEAIAVATQALEIDGADPEALFARGWARYLQDEAHTDDALADLDRALELEPDQGVGHYRRAVVLQARGTLDLAVQDFERAVQLAPDDVPARFGYGEILMQTNDFEHALAQFDAAVRLNPGDPSGWVGREHAHLSLKRYDDVVVDAREAIKVGAAGDDLANAHSLLATALWKKSDFAGAAREFQSAHALNDDHRIARSVGLMQWYSGQLPQAIQTFRQQVTWQDGSPYTRLWLFILQVQTDPSSEVAASAELAAQALPHQPRAWEDTLVDLMLGRTRIEAALVEADAADSYALRAGRRCEADFYAAERLLMHGQTEPANGLLEEAYWVCPSTYTEASQVEHERRRLAARSAKK